VLTISNEHDKNAEQIHCSNIKESSMKNIFASTVIAFAFIASVRAADVKLTDVHLCCQSCVKGVSAATSKIQGLTATSDMDEGTVTLTAADKATLQKGVDALVKAGYYGKSSDPEIKVASDTGAKGQKVKSLEVEDVHLCCGKCVTAVNKALSSVSGVTTNTATKNAKSFTISGDNFDDKEVFAALQKKGLTGKVGAEH
jgi:copper chaperone CopZ